MAPQPLVFNREENKIGLMSISWSFTCHLELQDPTTVQMSGWCLSGILRSALCHILSGNRIIAGLVYKRSRYAVLLNDRPELGILARLPGWPI